MPRSSPDMPQKLAQAAFELFAKHGFKDVNLDQVAEKAGVTKGSLYCHYDSKHALILAACNHYYRTYQQRVHRELAKVTDPLERLRAMLELSICTCVTNKANRVFTTEIFALALQDEQVRAGWAQFYDTVREIYIGLLIAAQATERLELGDARAPVDLMLSAIEGIKQRAAFEPHIADNEQQKQLVDRLMRIVGYQSTAEAA